MQIRLKDSLYVVAWGHALFSPKWNAEKNAVRAAGFRFDGQTKDWWTKDMEAVRRLLHAQSGTDVEVLVTSDIKAKLDSKHAEAQRALEMSRAKDADLDIPCPEGLSYLPFQRAGIAYALGRPNTLIGDDMGLGKTIQALGVINATPEIETILVIAPAVAKINWKREAEKWLVDSDLASSIGIVDGTHVPDTRIKVVNWDILGEREATEEELALEQKLEDIKGKFGRKHSAVDACKKELKKARSKRKSRPRPELAGVFDLVIADECHFAKNPKANRTKAFKAICKKAGRIIAMTGTPIVNRPIELYPILTILDKKRWAPKFWEYAKRYCAATKGRWGWDMKGSSNLGELQRILRETVMVRRLKTEVLTELPPKRRTIIEIDNSDYRGLMSQQQAALDATEAKLNELKSAVETAEDTETYKQAVRDLADARLAEFSELSALRHEMAVAKAPACAEQIKELLDNGSLNKIGVFGHHKDVLDIVMQTLEPHNPVRVDGSTSQKVRDERVQAFQNDPSVRVFVGSILASGTAITLTAGSTCFFVELDWVPGNVSQAEDRFLRIGTDTSLDAVNIYHMVVDGSIDSHMAKILVEKQEVIDAALDNRPVVEEGNQEEPTPGLEIVADDSFKSAQERAQEAAEASISENAVPRTHEVTLRKGGTVTITDEDINDIHLMLQYLAGRCDGAVELDGMGFNGLDSDFGKSLAGAPRLSPTQAAYGYKIVRKYKGQLLSWANTSEAYNRVYKKKEIDDE